MGKFQTGQKGDFKSNFQFPDLDLCPNGLPWLSPLYQWLVAARTVLPLVACVLYPNRPRISWLSPGIRGYPR